MNLIKVEVRIEFHFLWLKFYVFECVLRGFGFLDFKIKLRLEPWKLGQKTLGGLVLQLR